MYCTNAFTSGIDKETTIAAVNFDNLTHNSVCEKRKKVRECVYSNY